MLLMWSSEKWNLVPLVRYGDRGGNKFGVFQTTSRMSTKLDRIYRIPKSFPYLNSYGIRKIFPSMSLILVKKFRQIDPGPREPPKSRELKSDANC